MGSDEATTPSKSEKSSSPVKDQPVIYSYPDWTAMQAYYGPGVIPPPYFSTALPPGHAPHPFMWGAQPLLPPFGTPYAAFYAHAEGYSHQALPLGSQVHGGGSQSSASEDVVMANPLSMELPAKTARDKRKSPIKKVKESDGHSGSTSTGGYNSTDDSNYRSSAATGSKKHRKRGLEDKRGSVTSAPSESAGKQVGQVSSYPVIGMNSSFGGISKVRAVGTPIPPSMGVVVPSRNGVPSDFVVKDERVLKRERRRQSNRESARRSRLRKQAEAEELAMKIESLAAENSTLKSEISHLSEVSEKLRSENSALMVKLNNARPGQMEPMPPDDVDRTSSMVVENFLSMIDKPKSSRSGQFGNQEQNNSGKLHQLMDSSTRTDAVAAS